VPTETLRILVVDDEPDICWALERILRSAGHLVTVMTRGAEALAQLARERYDLAFIDAKLFDLDGYELATRIMHQSPRTTRILMSGYFDAEDPGVATALAQHLFSAFITKPFVISDIRQIVHHVVRERREESKGGADPDGGR